MITLKSFGGVDLHGDDNRPLQAVLAQPKRLAVVLYLGIATPRGFHRRDTLLALLWPDHDETRARKALNRAIHYIRTAIGDDVLPSRGLEELGLDWSRIWSDVAGFEEALDRGELAEALALYRGPLLPGFFVDEAPAFERWLEGERVRLERRAMQAARQLSEQEERAGRLIPAIEWARRATTFAPHDEAALRRVMALLEKGGDRGGAIRAYDDFSKGIERELDVGASPETRALADAIRARAHSAAGPEPGSATPGGVVGTLPAAVTPGTPIYIVAQPAPVAPPSGRGWNAKTPMGIALVAGVLLAGVWAVTSFTTRLAARGARDSHGAPAASKTPVAVLEFSFRGANVPPALANGIRRRMSAVLDSEPSVRVVASKAPGDAGFVVAGKGEIAGQRLTLSATLQDSVGSATQVGFAKVDGFVSESDRLARELAAQVAELAAFRKPVTDATPGAAQEHPAAALDAWEQGRVAYDHGRYDEAARLYRRAVDVDSTYAIAYLTLSMADDWEGQWVPAAWANGMAMKHRAELSPLDQLRVRSWDAWMYGRPVEAERLLRLILANAVDGDSQYRFGDVLFHWGPELGDSRADARHAFAVLDTLGFPNSFAQLVHRARIAAMDYEPARVDSLVARASALRPDSTQTLDLRAIDAFAGSATRDQSRVLEELSKATGGRAMSLATLVAVCGLDNESSARAIDLLLVPTRGATLRADGVGLREAFDLAHGRWDGGAQLEASHVVPGGRVAELRAVAATMPFVVLPRDTIEAIRAALMNVPGDPRTAQSTVHAGSIPVPSMRRWYLLGLSSVRLGDHAGAARYADSLNTPPFIDATDQRLRARLAQVIRASSLRAQGKPADALAALGDAEPAPNHVLPGLMSYPDAYERFLRAELLYDLHRDDEALDWYGAFPDPAGDDLPYVAPALFREAEIAERAGNQARATTLRARANGLWRNAGVEFRGWMGR